jgi:hypothetical protein
VSLVQALPKRKLLALANLPRDAFFTLSLTSSDSGRTVNLMPEYNMLGLDVQIVNPTSSTTQVTVTINSDKTVTLNAGETFSFTNVLYDKLQFVIGSGATCQVYFAGITLELLEVLP